MLIQQTIALTIIIVIWLGRFSIGAADDNVTQPTTFRVLSFNIWAGGESDGQPLEQTAAVIRASQADIAGLQEVKANARAIADLLGWKHVQQNDSCAVLSRFRILGTTRLKHGVRLCMDGGQKLYAFNVHLPAAPYQPYQLLRIPYKDAPFLKTEAEAIAAAREARGRELSSVLEEIASVTETELPIVLTGDFNEPSHLDWTADAASAGRHPLKVDYPTSHAVNDAGFSDTFRTLHPDEERAPGHTWTPLTTADDSLDHHDRIDFVYARGRGMTATCVAIIGEHESHADRVVAPYPSDHRAVVTTLTIDREAKDRSE